MSNNLLLAAAIGAALFLVVKKQAQAGAVAQGTAPRSYVSPPQVKNLNGDMWKSLLGQGFVSAAGSGTSGLIKNIFGQLSTSDGKPVGGADPRAGFIPVLTGNPLGGQDYLSSLMPITGDLMGWKNLAGGGAPETPDIYYSDDLEGLF
ncbi:hypothetical protein [Duganella sp. BuS-21]|uniref:hypothetical protein n=1 Tax=Duganella sp. BuS-21 TaxID=2943848 RepID=UPI0035A673C2